MRIGLITGEYPPMQGGVGDCTHELANALATLSHEVHVIARVGCGLDEAPLQGAEDNGFTSQVSQVTVHPVIPYWGWQAPGRVLGLAHRLHLDVLNLQYQAAAYDLHPAINFLPWRASFFLTKRRGLTRPSIVVTFHDLKVPYLFPKAGPLRDWVVTLLARQADAVIVTNRADELDLAARRVGRVERIPIGSNIAPALRDNYDRDAWRAGLGVARKDFLLGFFGFLNARKGIETLIRTLAALDGSYHLLFIGGTVGSSDPTNRAYADHVEALITELGLCDRVHYAGYVPAADVSSAFAAVDLCVLPYVDGISFHHGTLMAALAHSQPIVSTKPLIELSELVHGQNLWLVPPEAPEALVTAITTLAADPGRRNRLAQGAAELSAQFNWQRIAARTADLLESVKREA